MNSEKALLRRHEDNLNVCGMGIIILGAWDVLKVIMQLLLESKEMFQFDLEATEEEKAITLVVLIAIIAIFILLSALIFLFHVYIGRNAMKEAKGQPFKKGYFVWAVILLVLSLLGTLSYADEIKEAEVLSTTIASIIVDLTSIYILATLVISSRKVKALRAELTQE
ncbi:hypothetical protein [Butyrivibrio sp. AE2032]|uniref:hypothetical protein n=1 Tax=Butyrivibrio sp. AE2032 TaxID=1458463 RepID=UPI00054FAE5F|nr:hypothetical protein [Butyrivibrio sp. AE2032]